MEVDTPVHTAPISGAIDAPGEAVGQDPLLTPAEVVRAPDADEVAEQVDHLGSEHIPSAQKDLPSPGDGEVVVVGGQLAGAPAAAGFAGLGSRTGEEVELQRKALQTGDAANLSEFGESMAEDPTATVPAGLGAAAAPGSSLGWAPPSLYESLWNASPSAPAHPVQGDVRQLAPAGPPSDTFDPVKPGQTAATAGELQPVLPFRKAVHYSLGDEGTDAAHGGSHTEVDPLTQSEDVIVVGGAHGREATRQLQEEGFPMAE